MKHCHLVFFVALVNALAYRCQVMGHCQPPVEEGSPYTMNCWYPLSRALQFSWTMSPDNAGQTRRIYNCEFYPNRSCYDNAKYKINVTNNYTNTRFKSSLTISNTTAEHRHDKLQCIVWDPTVSRSNKRVIIKKCKVKSYHAPESITCESVQLANGRIKQTCRTTKVFPGIFCKLFQAHDGEFEKIPSEMTYDQTPNSDTQDALYYSASCSFSYPSDSTDKDYFKLKMFASVDGTAVPGSEKIISINIPTMFFKVSTTISKSAKKAINRSTKSRQIPINAAPQHNRTEGKQTGEIITKDDIRILIFSFIGAICLVFMIVFIFCVKKLIRNHRGGPRNNNQYNSVINQNKDPTFINLSLSVV